MMETEIPFPHLEKVCPALKPELPEHASKASARTSISGSGSQLEPDHYWPRPGALANYIRKRAILISDLANRTA